MKVRLLKNIIDISNFYFTMGVMKAETGLDDNMSPTPLAVSWDSNNNFFHNKRFTGRWESATYGQNNCKCMYFQLCQLIFHNIFSTELC